MADSEEGEGAANPRHLQEEGEEVEEVASRGNGWEVVSLTASAYAAAPGPNELESVNEEKDDKIDKNEAETSQALFMSGHFVFPPSQHENLPVVKEDLEMHKEDEGSEDKVGEMSEEEGEKSQLKEEGDLRIPGLNITEFPNVGVFDGKSENLSLQDPDYRKATDLQSFNLSKKEEDFYGTGTYSSFHGGSAIGESATYDGRIADDSIKSPDSSLDSSSDTPRSPTPRKADKDDGSDVSPRSWFKKRVACLCAHAKETNAFWSIFVAAAVMGLVILGQRWQQERWQGLQERWQDNLNTEKSSKTNGSLSRFKDILVGGSRGASCISSRTSADH